MKTQHPQKLVLPSTQSLRSTGQLTSPLQRVIDSSSRMQAQQQQAALPAQLKRAQQSPSYAAPAQLVSAKGIMKKLKTAFKSDAAGTVKDAITLNTPGPTTGPLAAPGALIAAANIASVKGKSVPKSFVPGSIGNTIAGTYVGSGAAIAGDVVSLPFNVINLGKNVVKIGKNRSAAADAKLGYAEEKMLHGDTLAALIDTTAQTGDLYAETTNIASNAPNLHIQHLHIPTHAIATAGGVVTAAAGVGLGVNAIVTARATRNAYKGFKAGRSWKRLGDKYKKVDEALALEYANDDLAVFEDSAATTGDYSQDSMASVANFGRKKMFSKFRRQGIGALGASAGTAAGALGVVAAVGVTAAMLTPVGWGLAGGSAVVGLGVGAYVLGRRIHKSRNGQLGVERGRRVDALMEALQGNPIVAENGKSYTHKLNRLDKHGLGTDMEIVARTSLLESMRVDAGLSNSDKLAIEDLARGYQMSADEQTTYSTMHNYYKHVGKETPDYLSASYEVEKGKLDAAMEGHRAEYNTEKQKLDAALEGQLATYNAQLGQLEEKFNAGMYKALPLLGAIPKNLDVPLVDGQDRHAARKARYKELRTLERRLAYRRAEQGRAIEILNARGIDHTKLGNSQEDREFLMRKFKN